MRTQLLGDDKGGLKMNREVFDLRIVLFAGARTAVGEEEVVLGIALCEGEVGVSANQVLIRLGDVYPSLRKLIPSCRLAVDCEYVSGETLIDRSASEIALIPPVSGG